VRTVDCDVAIVGAGPVGLVLAILLGQRGHSVVVLERWSAPYGLPRAVHFDHEVGRILQACGIGDELRSIIEPAGIYEWRNAAGTVLLRFGRHGDGSSGWPTSSMFCQPELEALLARRAEALDSVEVMRGVEVTAVDQTDDHAVIGAAGTTVAARYVVGCDGANSTVRGLAHLGVNDLGFFYDWLIVDVVLDEQREFDPLNLQVCDPARPTTAVSGGPGRRRWEFMRLPDESLDRLNSESRAWELLADWDVTPDNARLERHAVYTFQARHAERWRDRRVLLAGDAAHQMPPFAGQGMCAGVRDAANLAWKLGHVLAGVADDTLLDTYEQERLPHALRAIEFSRSLGEVICVPDVAAAAARDEAMAAGVSDEASDVPDLPGVDVGLVRVGDPHAGGLFVQATVDGALFDDVHGAGWRLVTIDPDGADLDAAATERFAAIGGLVVALDGSDTVAAGWFADTGIRWVVQRPDFRIYGTSVDAGGASELLDDLHAQLASATPIDRGPE